MDDRHKSQDHIRAARDWLGEAEHSLAREDDIQGDLKVMLAKAELAQVQDSPRTSRLRRWGKYILPPVTAVLLVFGGFWGWQYYTSQPAAPEAARTTVVAGDADPVVVIAAQTGAPAEEETPAAPPAALPAAENVTPAEAQVVTPAPALEQPPAPVLKPRQPEAEAAAPAPAVPDARKQRLMQAAGQVLKAP